MTARQRIVRERRQYNQWVASQTLEDYALRYTADRARKSAFRVGNTAFGPIAFLACEAIGGALTIAYGFPNTAWAIVAFCALMFVIGLPICSYAARYGVDIDLLTRGAGFGYMGSTITSLIYASFTFLLFAIEASIMSLALQMLFGIPLAIGHLISSLMVIPIAIYGFSLISKMQLVTQPVWIVLQLLPIAYIAWKSPSEVAAWTGFTGEQGSADGSLDLLLFGMAVSMLLSLLPQIGEQVDYLRFLPNRDRRNRVAWWTALIASGPGWVFMGGFKLLAGSFLAFLALRHGVLPAQADEPTGMYFLAFRETVQSPTFALLLTGIFVIVCQLKINVTNAYAGSIAWSNFFSRLTHSHPGRVVWLVFNVLLALLLMETGIFNAIESILIIYANFAAGWIGALTADLVVNKPLGYSPPYIEFKRAHLYDINPVGVGALLLSIVFSSLAFLGVFGTFPQILSPFVALLVAFVAAPVIAWATKGRYYLARQPEGLPENAPEIRCTMCENVFGRNDMAMCPAYSGPICSLCCTLEARCHDLCKTDSRFTQQLHGFFASILPERAALALNTRGGHFFGLLIVFNLAIGLLLSLIYHQYSGTTAADREAIRMTLWLVFISLFVLTGVAAWLIVLAHESRRSAEAESARQTAMLMDEIEAHKRTDAALQKAKEVAEAANVAKTRYIVGISHEIRSPLNAIFGYAQLLERDMAGPADNAARVIRRSAEHLTNLIDGLLDISRIENGMLRLNRDKVQLVEFLDQIVDMFRLQASNRGIEFRFQRPPHLPAHVYTDQKRLRQILINLLSNAIKYTERGHASLVVRYRNQVAEFEISDTGVGIAEADLERVFQPFERGETPTVRAVPGIGLGLTITKLLTQIMGGELLARSTVGEGTTFTVRLLLSEAMHAVHQSTETGRITGHDGPPLKLLLIDDDPAHLDIVRRLLQPLKFDVVTAPNGRTGLALAMEHRPALVMIDISMPDLSGWEVAKQLRECTSLGPMKIVMVSANAHEYSPGGPDYPHDGFVMKPVDMHALLDCIAGLLGLQWNYETGSDAAEELAEPCELPPDSRHHINDLYQLGRIGHVRGIQAKLRQIEADDPGSKAFTAHMQALVANFDLKRYMNVLETMRNDEP
ncbi:response regulator [Steroidobacter sp. S1-65]|uniref:histidine kinase n=1 Tax=Steroidobacter gossypii TaxID=2805490 RepID=A0ABS1WV04_9GAMM|nr:ATP-binding protein [Steroidobacter gossypii]MBM0104793.1 response regulator [Steroidobacter gossypii]